jgi:hypothetical protein
MYRAFFILMVASTCLAGRVGTYTAWTSTYNWASTNHIVELSTVANEIYNVTTSSTNTLFSPGVGDNAASADSTPTNLWTLREMQDLIENKYDELWFGTNILEGATNQYALSALGGIGTYENIFPFTDFLAFVGLNTNGFRRAITNWPSDWTDIDDPAFSYGKIEVGDIFGPWVEDEIMRCFDGMTQNVIAASWYVDGDIVVNKGETVSSLTNTWGEVVAQVTANWPSPDTEETNSIAFPRHRASEIRGGVGLPSNYYSAFAEAQMGKARSTVYGIGIPRTVDFYQRSTTVWGGQTNATRVFNANGDDVVNGQWHMWEQTDITPTSQVDYATSTNYLGSVSLPEISATTPTENIPTYRGWYTRGGRDKLSGGPNSADPLIIQNFEWSYTRE